MEELSRANKYANLKELHISMECVVCGQLKTSFKIMNEKDGKTLKVKMLNLVSYGDPIEVNNLETYTGQEAENFIKDLYSLNIESWEHNSASYYEGLQWKIVLSFEKEKKYKVKGSSCYPNEFIDLIKLLSRYAKAFDFFLQKREYLNSLAK